MQTPTTWKEYELLDSGAGQKLERWGSVIVDRPDPAALWPRKKEAKVWERAQATYTRSESGKGSWQYRQTLPKQWPITYGSLTFMVRPTDFKHTGLFPEQAVNWEWMEKKIKKQIENSKKAPRILNLFAYTGGATLTCLAAGAEVTHVDASEGIITWARQNAELSHLDDRPVRWIVDDVNKFVAREVRRGEKYDAIIMDPPSYGRGKKNELWKIEEMLLPLVQNCELLLSEVPLFFIINTYTTGLSGVAVGNILQSVLAGKAGSYDIQELGLKPKDDGWALPAGVSVRWESR